jgi:UDP-N-acetylglucosamine acyltransferase
MRPVASRVSPAPPDIPPGPCTIGMQERADLRPLNENFTSWAHLTAVIDPSLTVGEGVLVGPYAMIGEKVTLGDGTQVAGHAQLAGWTVVGRNARIFPYCVLGSVPQDLKFSGCPSWVEIGDDNTFREFVTVNRATGEGARTTVGSRNLIMAYVHIAHDCHVGDETILANAATLAGHVTIESGAAVGGLTPIHQFVRIGRQAFVGGGSRVSKDVPPYVRAAGNPLRVVGLNSIGLERRGVPEDVRMELKRAYRLLYRSSLNVTQALVRMESELRPLPEIRTFIDFVRHSERGIT